MKSVALEKHAGSGASVVEGMHRDSAYESTPFLSMLKKDDASHKHVMNQYLTHWEGNGTGAEDTDEARNRRESRYETVVNNYYDLVTDLFESGWGQSFHLCRFRPGESFVQAQARHEHYLASVMNLQPGMKLLDVGCGVGGPAREIATFADCHVVGLNNNAYQIERARKHTQSAGLANKVEFVKGDFMNIPFPSNSFDAIYAIEATLHAPSLAAVYTEIHRVLKPGGTCALYEWVLTPSFSPSNPLHRSIRHRIEHGDGIPHLATSAEAVAAMREAGFTLVRSDDLADKGDKVPWWYPLAGEWRYVRSWWDAVTVFRVARWGRVMVMGFLKGLEGVGLCPGGTARAAETLEVAAKSLVEGGQEGIFSPMFLLVGRKEVDQKE
ncbi:hypothetical protein MMC13_007861 [Lambiella insularis]|nr:hypothetical protein [Lambiella insularis]